MAAERRRARARLLLTCEHAGRRVPRAWAACLAGRAARRALDSHRGWDPGALDAARSLARGLDAPLLACTTTRLLADANRSPTNPTVFSEWSRALPAAERAALLEALHRPHRELVRDWLRARLAAGERVLHVAVHSFAPVLRGRRRDFDVGLLYDPARRREREWARRWQRALRDAEPGLAVRRNAPYRGRDDGLPRALRRELPAASYLGFELELNQATLARPERRRVLLRSLARILRAGVATLPS